MIKKEKTALNSRPVGNYIFKQPYKEAEVLVAPIYGNQLGDAA